MSDILYANKRKQGEEKQFTEQLYDVTVVTEDNTTSKYFRLDEVPLRYINTVTICVNDIATSQKLYEQIGGTPSIGYFVVNYDMGLIYINSNETVTQIKVTYKGTGSVFLVEDIDNLQNQITELKQRGKFLSLWNSITGKPLTDPTSLPYTYHTGDYFIVKTVDVSSSYPTYNSSSTYNTGDKCTYSSAYYICNSDNVTGTWDATKWTAHTLTNYKPTGISYTGVASTTIETETVNVNNIYYFDGTVWQLQSTSSASLTWGSLTGNISNQTDLSTALNNKQISLKIKEYINGAGFTAGDTTLDVSTDFTQVLHIYRNGLRLNFKNGSYTITNLVITFTDALLATEDIAIEGI